jgi:DNA-directed RNA polymerase specialized sigma24 family protein
MNGQLARQVDVSDVVQESQLEAARRLDDFFSNPQIPPKIGMRQLLIDRLTDKPRKHLEAARRAVGRKYQPEPGTVDVAALLLACGVSPSRMASERETSEQVLYLLRRLKDEDPENLMMHFLEEPSGPEAASALGIEPAVKCAGTELAKNNLPKIGMSQAACGLRYIMRGRGSRTRSTTNS